ncbi:MAG: hypothetical protein AAFX85_00755 [Pseudomonadota bacterium]
MKLRKGSLEIIVFFLFMVVYAAREGSTTAAVILAVVGTALVAAVGFVRDETK